MKKNEILESWEIETQKLTEYFLNKYFNEKDYEPEWYWISELIGETLAVNDYFFNLEDIVNFIRYDYSKKMMFEYYDLRFKSQTDNFYLRLEKPTTEKTFPNIENYKKLKKEKICLKK